MSLSEKTISDTEEMCHPSPAEKVSTHVHMDVIIAGYPCIFLYEIWKFLGQIYLFFCHPSTLIYIQFVVWTNSFPFFY